MNITLMNQITDWLGKRVIVRAGLNVPIDSSGKIADDFRLQRVLPTIVYLQQQGAKVIIIGHIGRDPQNSFNPAVVEYLQQVMDLDFKQDFFTGDVAGKINELTDEIDQADEGTVWLLDNLRADEREKKNDPKLAQNLASLADIYVNEAFSVSHRKHMSMFALPQNIEQKIIGYACDEEIEQLSLALDPPEHSLAIISGNKFATKLPLIKKFLKTYETVLVGGALANTLYSLAGYNIGRSVYEDDLDEESVERLLEILKNKKLYLPTMVVCGKEKGEKVTKHISDVGDDEYIYDCAPEALTELGQTIKQSKIIVWNGPLGYYEGGYTEGTEALLELVASSEAISIVGGGNTVDLVRDLGYAEEISFLSTGGGAMIEFLTHGSLPALDVLDNRG